MMKQFLLTLAFISSLYAQAQNVGIGTPSPFAKLEISSGSAFKPSISIKDSSAFAGWIQMSQIGSGRNLNLFGFRSTDGNSASQYLDIATDSTSLLTLRGSGNVGVNKDQPTEKLHVRGNINVENGTIKANGVAGQPGQMLMTNNNGQLQWMDKSEYKNFVVFTQPGTANWTVPAGVTKILAEGWGAGGGGSSYAGGGGGGYFIVKWIVNPGDPVILTIGAGGTGQTSVNAGSNGGQSSVLLFAGGGVFYPVQANGGDGAYVTFSSPNIYIPGRGGNYSINPNIVSNADGLSGNTGLVSQIDYLKGPSDQLLYIQKDGVGGNGAMSPNSGGNAMYTVFNIATNQYIYRGGLNTNGALNTGGGGGAGSGIEGNPASLLNGGNGVNGKIIIYY